MVELNIYQLIRNLIKVSGGSRKLNLAESSMPTDTDVQNEIHRIKFTPNSELMQTDMLVVRDLTKFYGQHLAVDRVCFGVRSGECFGLLGVNGAGKTTTFKMLTGDEKISAGDAFVRGYSCRRDMRKVQQYIGYCPQFDGLIDRLTGRETLTIFARLRGVPETQISEQIHYLSQLLYFEEHVDKWVVKYSGGTKRKLSAAVAFIGDPDVVFLDEPTSGMDPVARRCLWDAIVKMRARGKAIVLTSHSMDECEALCTRLVIMVNGVFCTLGSAQNLKDKYAKGFFVLIKISFQAKENPDETVVDFQRHRRNLSKLSRVSSLTVDITPDEITDRINAVNAWMQSKYPSAIVKSVHNGFIHYHIPDSQLRWSDVFHSMEELKRIHNIEDYSVSQTTLEQIFLMFTKLQKEET